MDGSIYNAVESNDPTALRQLLRAGGNVDEFYHDYTLISAKSILHMSCEKGRFECVKVLLEMGADLTIQDTWYQTPLMYCMLTQYDEIAELLLSHDPNIVDLGDKYGKSALHIAVEGGALDCIKVLLRHGADVNVINDFGVTPLMVACDSKQVPPDMVYEMVKLLIDHGANCHMKCYRNQRTPLQAGADLNINKYEQTNPLIIATRYRLTNVVAYFLANGADQNSQYYCNITPLMFATRNKDIRTLKVLLNYSSDLYRLGRCVRGDLDYNTDVFKMALDLGVFEAAMLIAEAGYEISRVDYLVDWTKTPPDSLIQDQPMLEFFRQQAVMVQTLYRLAVLSVRKRLRGYIPEKANALPLPKLLIRAVSLTNELT